MIAAMRSQISLLGFCLLIYCATTYAQVSQPVWTESYRLQALERIEAGQAYTVVDELLALSPIHAGDFEFDYFFGVAALKAQRYPLALDALERVVLLRPQHAGAWLDLAIVYHRLGDAEAAISIIDHVQRDFFPTPELQIQLSQIRAQLSQSLLTQNWRIELSAHLGSVSNANSGLSELTLVLTPTGGIPIPVEVASSLRARSSRALMSRASALKTFNDSTAFEHEVFISTGVRQFFSEQEANQSDLNLLWSASRPLTERWRLHAGPALRVFNQGDKGTVVVGSFFSALTTRVDNCVWGGRIEPEWRDYNRADMVSSVTPWLGATGRCALPGGLQWMGSTRFGVDNPSGPRAGGETRRFELSMQLRAPLTPEVWLDAGGLVGAYRDRDSYSQLVAEGERRHINRQVARLGLEWGLAPHGFRNMYVNAHYYYINDRSNISLSRLEDRQFFLGGRYELQ